MEEAQWNNWMVTGLIYVETGRQALTDLYNQPETPLNRLGEPDMLPGRESHWIRSTLRCSNSYGELEGCFVIDRCEFSSHVLSLSLSQCGETVVSPTNC